jgi:hypothetical protein
MTASNLAVVWSPNIFKASSPLFDLSGLTNFVEVMEVIILHTPVLFEELNKRRQELRKVEIEEFKARIKDVDVAGSEEKGEEASSSSGHGSKTRLTPMKKRSDRSPSPRKKRPSKSPHEPSKTKTPRSRPTPASPMSSTMGRSTTTRNYDSSSIKGIGDSLKARFSSLNKAMQGSQTQSRGSIFGLFDSEAGDEDASRAEGERSSRGTDKSPRGDFTTSEGFDEIEGIQRTNSDLASSISFSFSPAASPRHHYDALTQSESSNADDR